MCPSDTQPDLVLPSSDRRRGRRRGEDHRLLRRERELDAARRISESLGQHLSADALAVQALLTAVDVIGADGGSILLAEIETKRLVFRHSLGAKPVPPGTAIPWDQGIAGEVFQSGLPLVVRDAASDVRHYKAIDALTGYATHDLIALPLKRWEGEAIGVLEVLNKRKGRLDEEDLGLLSIISAVAAIAIERARLYEEARLAEIARVVGNIGHDVKNMLMPIICGTGLLEHELQDLLRNHALPREEIQAMTELSAEVTLMVRHSSRRIQDRMKEIADCIKGRSSPPIFAPCELRQVVKSVYDTLSWVADDRKVVLRTEGLDELPIIMADEHRLFNAFYNLVNNAIPEVPPGGSVTVSGRATSSHGTVLISVCDTGRGMSPEVRDSLFAAHARSTKSGGTGLGTKIVKDVVEAHGGTVTVSSQQGGGTTFFLNLPLHPPMRPVC